MAVERSPAKVALWRARDLSSRQNGLSLSKQCLSTGFRELDELLVDRGWPNGALIEILCNRYGIGELRFLASALTRSTAEACWTVLINPPCVPYAPAFQSLGINICDLMTINPNNHQEALWALEEVIGSGSCRIVLAWLKEEELHEKELRRIQGKSKECGVLAVLFRPAIAERRPSPAELRLKLEQQTLDRKLIVSIIKRRGGWRVDKLALPLPWGPTATASKRAQELFAQWERTSQTMPAAVN